MDSHYDLMNIKRIITKFDKLKYWCDFSSSNLFYISLENFNVCVLFSDTINDDTFGMYFIYEREGYNYLYNTLVKNKNDIMEYFNLDAISIEVVYKEFLTLSDKKLLNKQGLKTSNVNFFLGVNKPGKVTYGCDNKEIHLVSTCLSYLEETILKAKSKITQAFFKGLHTIIKVNENNRSAIVSFGKVGIEEISYPLSRINEDYYYKLKDVSYVNEKCSCYCSYLPVVYHNIRPLFVLFYFPTSKTLILNICLDNNLEDTVFSTFERSVATKDLPFFITFNNNKAYSIMKNTLTALNIESDYNIFNELDYYFNRISYSILRTLGDNLELEDNIIDEFMKNIENLFFDLLNEDEDF